MKKDTANKLLALSQKEYDAYASEFSNTRQLFWKELEYIKQYAKKGENVLDIGCGNGRLSDVLAPEGVAYTGIDFSKALITIAKKERASNGTYVHGDALALPFPDNSFDTVFSIAVLHHIPSQENRAQFVSEAHRVLKRDGTCVLTVWNTLQWRFVKTHVVHTMKKLCGFSSLDFGDSIIPFGKNKRERYIHSLTKRDLRSLFEKAGFKNITVQEVKRPSGYANYVVTAQNM